MSVELFSKISRRMWRDKKFCALSRPQPNARDLWVYLLSGPHNTSIPGLFVRGELGLAEDLDWDAEATRACLQEIVAQGMARFDRRCRLVWLPNAIHHNPPRSPKQITGWAAAWKLMPECDLLREAAAAIREVLSERSPKFAEAFDRVVSGNVDPTEVDEDAQDSSAPPSTRKSSRVLSDRDSGFYRIENENSMPFQEKEKEKEKEIPPSGGSDARVCAREGQPPQVQTSESNREPRGRADGHPDDHDAPPGHQSASLPHQRPGNRLSEVDLLDDERRVLEALRFRPRGLHEMSPSPLSRLAKPELARYLAAQAGPGGRLDIDDVVLAVRQAAEAELGSSATQGPREVGRLESMVRGYVKKARRGEARRHATDVDPAAVDQFLSDFDSAWSKAHSGRVRAPTAGDREHAERLVALADAGASKAGMGVARADVLSHWIREHLRCAEKFIVDADHPLRLLPGRVDSYGLPRPKRDPQPQRSPQEQQPRQQMRVPDGAAVEVKTGDEALKIRRRA